MSILHVSLTCLIMALASTARSHAGDLPPDTGRDPIALLRNSNDALRRFVLDNGMVCLVKEDHSAPVASVQIWVGTGSIHEEDLLGGGLCHAIEHMIFKGTARRAIGDITREINDAGGSINAYTSLDRTVFHTDLPARQWKVGLDVLSDAVMNATFPADEWKKEREVIIREMAMGRDDPNRVMDRLLWRTAFTTHPYRFPVIGFEDIFTTITRDNLASFFKKNYVPDNMITVIVGDINASEVESNIRATFKDFKRQGRVPVVLPQEPPQISPRLERETGPYGIARLELAFHAVPMSHPDAPALDVLAQVAGEGRSSRLASELKEKLGLVHTISAWSYTPREAGLFGISATYDPAKETAVITAIQAQIDQWIRNGFNRAELDKARRMVLSNSLSGLQTMHGQAQTYAEGEFYTRDARFVETYLKQLDRITPDMLADVARRYLRPENRTLTILSPTSTISNPAAPATLSTVVAPAKTMLPGGVPVITREDHRLPFVYFCVAMGGGVLSENPTNNGITKFMSELLVKGAGNTSAGEIASDVESRGAWLAPFSGFNSFGIQARCLRQDADRFARLLADCTLRPTFPADEVDRQRAVQCAVIEEEHERPFFQAQEQLRAMMFPGHPYSMQPSGTRESIQAITRNDILTHYHRHAVAGNMVVAVFGDIPTTETVRLVTRYFASAPNGALAFSRNSKASPTLPLRKVRKEPREQAIVLAGFPGVDILDPRADALTLLQYSLSGLSSDLGIAVRDNRGLAYYVGAYQQLGMAPGAFVLYAGTREDAVPEVEKLYQEEIARITGKGIRSDELERARRQLIANFEMSLQDNLSMAMSSALDELYGLGFQHAFDTRQRFETVTGDAVRQAAASILQPERMATSVVLPEAPPAKAAK